MVVTYAGCWYGGFHGKTQIFEEEFLIQGERAGAARVAQT
jgi:hypothetical protein